MKAGHALPVLAALAFLAGPLSSAGCRPAVIRHETGIIRGETVWEGSVEVRGVLMIDRSARLVIRPGTEVVFPFIDADGDGIGDGELNVLGELVARGTAEAPIVFRSDRGRKKDWTFLHLSGNRESVLEYCLFRDAFTGVQLHYVRADIRNCRFEFNHEGLRYSTIRGAIRNSLFRENDVGLRFEGRQSDVLVEMNVFQDNEIGVFPVTMGSEKDRFRRNLFRSRDYNVKLGIAQAGPLDFTDNFWGTLDADRIRETIFDGRRDPLLGTVRFEPYLREPASGAGPGDFAGWTLPPL